MYLYNKAIKAQKTINQIKQDLRWALNSFKNGKAWKQTKYGKVPTSVSGLFVESPRWPGILITWVPTLVWPQLKIDDSRV